MLFRDEGSKASSDLGPVLRKPRNGCQKREENVEAGEAVKRDRTREWLKFSCPTHSAQSQDSLPLNECRSRRMVFPK